MDKKLNTKLSAWTSSFKKAVVAKIIAAGEENDESPPAELLQFIYNYPNLIITKQDLQKRTRVKNTVPYHDT